uniref:Ubiquitin-like domain-containing protein n=1 Tax=Trypanosoma congolense (strain IL3000) TaxID=1068625 RepID=G0UMZ4_TRYCI|nr:conserved hypothetical protein [Trypanosoma congolense IL3000]
MEMHVGGRNTATLSFPGTGDDEIRHVNGRIRNPYAAGGSSAYNTVEDTAFSPVQTPMSQRFAEERGDLGVHPVTVQPRYRLHSPPLCGPSSCTSPRDSTLPSTSYARSCSNSFPCEVPQRQYPSAYPLSPTLGRSPDFSVDHNVGVPMYPGGYTPTGFVMPPALASVPPPRNDVLRKSPMHDTQSATLLKRPVSSPISCPRGSRYVSPMMSISPNYPAGSHQMCSPSITAPIGCNGMHVTVGNGERSHSVRSRQANGDGGSTVSGSSGSSIREDLPLCSNDGVCALINDRKHQRRFAHTCRLFPCYHGHVARHAKLFRHAPGQVAQSEELINNSNGTKKLPAEALISVSFSSISREAPNAYRIVVNHSSKSYEIFGDWNNVRVHTFKRYLHQVYNVPPPSQVLMREESSVVLDDDLESVAHYGVKPDSVLILKRKEDNLPPSVLLEDL